MFNLSQPFSHLLAYLLILYIRPHEWVDAVMNWPLLSVLLLLAFALWLGRQPKNFEAPQFWLMPVLTLMLMLSVIFSGWFGGGIKALSDFFPVVLLFTMIATSVDSIARLRQVFVVLAVSAVVLSWHGVDQLEKGIGWTGAELSQKTRITYLGFLNDPNDLGMALVMALPMVVYLGTRASKMLSLVWYAAAGLVAYAIYLTNSRGATLAIGSMVGLFCVLRFGLFRSVVAIPLLLGPLIALGPSRMAEISADEDSAEGRIEAWYEGVLMLIRRPLFGVGKGQFADHHNNLTAHNSFVLAFAELGLLGYFFWLSNLIITWLMLHKLVKYMLPAGSPADEVQRWDELKAAARTLWCGFAAGLTAAFFLSRSYVVILYIHIALVVALFQMARTMRPEFPAVLFGPIAGRLFLASLGSVVVMWLVTRVLLAFT